MKSSSEDSPYDPFEDPVHWFGELTDPNAPAVEHLEFTFRSPHPSSASDSEYSAVDDDELRTDDQELSPVQFSGSDAYRDPRDNQGNQHLHEHCQEHQFTFESLPPGEVTNPFKPVARPKQVDPSSQSALLRRLEIGRLSGPSDTQREMRLPFRRYKSKTEAGPSNPSPSPAPSEKKKKGETAASNANAASPAIDSKVGACDAANVITQDGQGASFASHIRARQYIAPQTQSRRGMASCTHPTMVRMYCFEETCDICHEFGQFGWLYRCTQDREEIIREQLRQGDEDAAFDELGDLLSKLVGSRPRGPESRATDKYSFFEEITTEQLNTYTPDQIKTILHQHENVKKTIKKQMAQRKEVNDEENRRMMRSLTGRPARGRASTTECQSPQQEDQKIKGKAKEKEVGDEMDQRLFSALKGRPLPSPPKQTPSQPEEQSQMPKGQEKDVSDEENEKLLSRLFGRAALDKSQSGSAGVGRDKQQREQHQQTSNSEVEEASRGLTKQSPQISHGHPTTTEKICTQFPSPAPREPSAPSNYDLPPSVDMPAIARELGWSESSIQDLAEKIRPWVPRPENECRYKICQRCRPGCVDRAYLSLGGIADGDVPATAATGFGFHIFEKRPVVDVEIIKGTKNANQDPVNAHAMLEDYDIDANAHVIDATDLNMISEQGAVGPSMPSHSIAHGNAAVGISPVSPSIPPGSSISRLPRSPASDDLPHLTNAGYAAAVHNAKKRERKGKGKESETEENEGGKQTRGNTEMEEREMEEGEFGKAPLEVRGGVAVSEEGVELHKADVITHKD